MFDQPIFNVLVVRHQFFVSTAVSSEDEDPQASRFFQWHISLFELIFLQVADFWDVFLVAIIAHGLFLYQFMPRFQAYSAHQVLHFLAKFV